MRADQSGERGYWGGGALKRQELKLSALDGGGIQSCRSGQNEETDVFF